MAMDRKDRFGLTAKKAYEIATSVEPLDYEELGFMCGLEIHQQLATRKLFSPCPSDVIDSEAVKERTTMRVDRRLRATQSELGETDPAAIAEAKKRKAFRYLAIDGLTSLVELDEEPPHPMSEDALDVTLTFAGLLGSKPADEIHVMRKTVIDGSNTSGFQRTALVATGGTVQPENGAEVSIWTVAVEEDSARKLNEDDGIVTYTLDRLGIPLIEVATGPDITDPKHAQDTARRLGSLLRATSRVRRGLGSIRQDLNVSIGVGERVEIKGCQDLRAVPRVIEAEVRRQLWLHYIAETLRKRGFKADAEMKIFNVTACFNGSDSKVIAGALKKGQNVMALRLPCWAGLIQGASKDGPRYGREFADHAKMAAGVRGVFHSDELPAYGITEAEVAAVSKGLKLEEKDAFVLCVENEPVAAAALTAVAECAVDSLRGAGRAVRAVQPDDSTRFMRPLPGAARMYPETDVPPITISADHWAEVLDRLPPLPEEVVSGYMDGGLSEDMSNQIVRDGHMEQYAALSGAGVEPSIAGRIITQFMPELQHPGLVVIHAKGLGMALADGRLAKEAIPAVLQALDGGAKNVDAAIESSGTKTADAGTVDAVIQGIIDERLDFVKERGMGAMGPLMGPVMAELRGKVDGSLISERLKVAIERTIQ